MGPRPDATPPGAADERQDESGPRRYRSYLCGDRPDGRRVGRARSPRREADRVKPRSTAARSGTAGCSSPRRALRQRPRVTSQSKPMPRTPTRMTTAVMTQPRMTGPSTTDVFRPRWPSARFSSLLRAEPLPGAVQRAERLTPRPTLPRHGGLRSPAEPSRFHPPAQSPKSARTGLRVQRTPACDNGQGLHTTLRAQTALLADISCSAWRA